MGGRRLIDITQLHDKQAKLLQAYFLNKQVMPSLHAAVVKADDRCTPLDWIIIIIIIIIIMSSLLFLSKYYIPTFCT